MKKIAVVTGASRGIGYAVAKEFALRGFTVYAVARNKEKLEALRLICEKEFQNFDLIPVVLDLNGLEATQQLLSLLKRNDNRVDILVNNAGLLVHDEFEKLTEENMQSMFEVNVFAPIRLIRGLSSVMGGKQLSHIVNIGSMAGFQGSDKFPGLTLYSATKGAIASFTECLAKEYEDRNIKVNCLALGSVNTEMLKQAFPGLIAPVEADQMGKYIADFSENVATVMNGKVIPVSM